jgi:hypothetical protein
LTRAHVRDGHLLRKRDVRATSAFPLIATTSRTRRHVAKVPKGDLCATACFRRSRRV